MLKKLTIIMASATLFIAPTFNGGSAAAVSELAVEETRDGSVVLGNEKLLEDYSYLIEDRRVGLVTNHTGIDSDENKIADEFAQDDDINLTAIYTPEHGLDGEARAGEYVESYTHEQYDIPVYSLYGANREPTEDMVSDVDVLLFDIQDIGARTYTYISTMNYTMVAASKYDVPVVVLDRPNPLGGIDVEGPMMEEEFKSFVGVDILPKAHGMTIGELARYFNRDIEADLSVVPMENYQRNMIFQDTGLPWVGTSPNIPTLESAFGYMATGLGEGTGVYQGNQFTWIGGTELDSQEFADKLNNSDLEGIEYIPEDRHDGEHGGVRLNITDYYAFNPARAGIFSLAYAFQLGDFDVPTSSSNTTAMFDLIMGTDQMGEWLANGYEPEEIEERYSDDLNDFKRTRENYLIEDYEAEILIQVNNSIVDFDVPPYMDAQNRLQVPVRAIAESLGAYVEWDGSNQLAEITRGDENIKFTIDSSSAEVNNQTREMDTYARIIDGRTMIPVRYVGEFLGATVDWNGEWQIVHIN